MNFKDEKCLIAYYSRRGFNYVSGNIVNLPVGNTEIAAIMIRDMTEGNLFQIDTVDVYPVDYTETTEVAKREKRENAHPLIKGQVDDMDSYTLVFLGYPNWWGTMPMAVFTFLESYDFSGKLILPFCTHEGSGLGSSVSDIKSTCNGAKVSQGLAIHGSRVKEAGESISQWIKNI